uniref:Uncharacterized protein n=1 Tax=Oryza barthii TaxID=65489 RepID=A0A0D3H8F1_9ORYZ
MGCCVSRSTAAAAVERRQVVAVDATAAMVMDLDGTMARLEAPVAARVALGGDAYSCFVCGADELDYGAPARAMGDDEALQPGQLYFVLPGLRAPPAAVRPRHGRARRQGQRGALQHRRADVLYFVLPVSALRRPLSGQDMAALAVKAIAALGASATAAGSSSGVSSRGKNARPAGKQRPQATARVAPLVAAGADHVYGGYDSQKTVRGDRTARINGGGSIARQRTGLQRLSAISEGDE